MMPDEVNKWIQKLLGDPDVFMLRSIPGVYREMKVAKNILKTVEGDVTSNFVSCVPLHIVNKASVRDLQKQSGADFDHTLFRANIVIDTPIAYEEDEFYHMRIGNAMIRQNGPC